MQTLTTKLERFFVLFLFINPVLDIVGGLYISWAETFSLPNITPSLLVRMAMLALFAVYILVRRDGKAILSLLPVGIAWVLSVVGEVMFFYAFDLSADVQYIVRFGYNLAVVLVYFSVF